MNESVTPNAMTPRVLTENNLSLNIPVYQRLFVWEEEQIKLLLDDLFKSCKDSSGKSPYYIGIITVVKQDNEKWDIVDGQQRLTFLTLFGAYILAHQDLYSQQARVWKDFLFSENNELRINYAGRSEDRQELKFFAENKFDVIHNRNFQIFNECMDQFVQKLDFMPFAEYVYNHTSFLVSILPKFEANDLNLFFEKMNSAGRQLTPVEQIKGKHFPGKAAMFDACLNFEERFIEERFNYEICRKDENEMTLAEVLKQEEAEYPENISALPKEGDRSILKPEIFLLHVLEIAKKVHQQTGEKEKLSVSHDEREILKQFNADVGSNLSISPDVFLQKMKEYRQFLDDEIIFIKNTSDGSGEYCLREEEESQQLPIEKEKEQISRWKNKKQFQSMLYVSSSNWQKWVLDAYRDYRNGKALSVELLKQRDNERNPLPSLSAMSYPDVNRYWFWKLDYLLWEQFTDDEKSFDKYDLTQEEKSSIRNYKFRSNRSIEHLHPQTDGDIDEWKDAKHQFGNLAMISSSFNSMQQNDSIGVKFARLKDTQIPQGSLESIKMLLMFALAGRQEEGWTTGRAEDHGKAMYELLKEFHNTEKPAGSEGQTSIE